MGKSGYLKRTALQRTIPKPFYKKKLVLFFLEFSRRRVCLKELSKGKQLLTVSFKHFKQAGD
ncbi:hypothetical protein ACEQPO_28360 [Bacillus sp. SL00103]